MNFSPCIFYNMENINIGIVQCTYPNIMPNYYSITTNGEIYSHHRNKFMYKSLDNDGYFRVVLLHTTGKNLPVFVHRLVAWEYIINSNPNEYNIVNHINTIKNDNNYNNLEWCNDSYNKYHAKINGLLSYGENHYRNVYSEKMVREICNLFEQGYSFKDVLIIYNTSSVKNRNVYNIIKDLYNKRVWKHIVTQYSY